MERDQLGTLSPADAAVALRSFPRRYREAVDEARAKRADLDVIASVGGHRAPLIVVVAAGTVLERLRQGVEHTLTDAGPSLEPSLLDRTALESTSGMTGLIGQSPVTALDLLKDAVAAGRSYLDELEAGLSALVAS